MTSSHAVQLVCGAQSYDWGKLGKDGSKVSQFAQATPGFVYDEEKPYAELWMGTHPSCPSRLLSTQQSLKEYLEQRPELLGKNVINKFGPDLPFLFKVLAIRKALSIQAHPDKQLAQKLHSDRPDIYKDPNHKPEMAVALTPFSGFCGFRPPSQIASFLSATPEFAALVGDTISTSFQTKFASSPSPSEEEKKAGLRELFSALMNADVAQVKKETARLVTRLRNKEGNETQEIRDLVETLNKDFEGDVGIFCTFMLNIVKLNPGEAVFLKANEPHAYLDGDIMECMATSDNVVRAGLTPKLRDVPTLTSMLTYTSSPPSEQILPPVPYKSTSFTTLYDPPIEEFSVLLTDLALGHKEVFDPIEGPSILLITKLTGPGTLRCGGENFELVKEGQAYFIGAGVEVELVAEGGRLTAYRAFVEVSE